MTEGMQNKQDGVTGSVALCNGLKGVLKHCRVSAQPPYGWVY